MARPRKVITEAQIGELLCAIAGGANREDAAKSIGVSAELLKRRMREDSEFRSRVHEADSIAVKTAEQKVFSASDWKASLAWLQAKRPEIWGQKSRTEVTGKNGEALKIVVEYADSQGHPAEATPTPDNGQA